MKSPPRFFRTLQSDLPASLVVFLVALPLCLGIALASGAPLISGLIAGIVGGIVVGSLSGARLGVSGPAAGLAVIVLAAIEDLGAFDIFLVAVILAGLIQIALGFFRAGTIAYYFPSSVISGMLSGIGIIIFLKQIPHAFGYDADPVGELSFRQPDGENTFSELLLVLDSISPGPLIIASVSLAILLLWESRSFKTRELFTLIPGPLVAVVTGVLLHLFFRSKLGLALAPEQIVSIPEADSLSGLVGFLTFPDFSALTNINVYKTAVVLAIVASLETLLSAEATDKLDPLKRVTPPNRELKAQGVGNIISGLLGGLPVTQVIVRSSANVQSGARSKASTVIHGLLLAVSVIALPTIMNLIPLATLAAILFVVGFKLAKPSVFRKMLRQGPDQFVPFMVTVCGIVFTDLLVGISLGMVVAVLVILFENFRLPFEISNVPQERGERVQIALAQQVTFLNKASVLKTLDSIPDDSSVEIDASESVFVHPDVVELIDNFVIGAEAKNIDVVVHGLDHRPHVKRPTGMKVAVTSPSTLKQELSMRTQTKEIQAALTPQRALELLREGNARFQTNLKVNRNLLEQVNTTADGQYPMAVILSCIDSRTSAELIFDQGLGDIFSVRVAGNVLSDDVLGSMEFACKLAGSKLIVVLGHSACGAVHGAVDGVKLGKLAGLLRKIQPSVELVEKSGELPRDEFIQRVAKKNVEHVVQEVRERSQVLDAMIAEGQVGIVGAMYSVQRGTIEFQDMFCGTSASHAPGIKGFSEPGPEALR